MIGSKICETVWRNTYVALFYSVALFLYFISFKTLCTDLFVVKNSVALLAMSFVRSLCHT